MPSAPITVRVDLVQMDCIVEDKHGSPIHGLILKDFAVKEDGHVVSAQYLRTDSDVPISVALLIDVSLSQKGMLPVYADAVATLKSKLTAGRDRVSIFSFGHSVHLVSNWEDPSLLDARGIEAIAPNNGTALLTGHKWLPGGTLLFDAIKEAVKRTQGLTGRKAIVVLTDGIDEGSVSLSPMVAHDAQTANVSVSALEFKPHGLVGILGSSTDLPAKLAYDGLARMSNGTGGVILQAKRGQEKEQIENIMDLLKEQYVIEFTPDGLQAGLHHVAISVDYKDARLRTRRQFWQY